MLLSISITACSIPIGDLFNRDIVLAAEEEKVAYGDVNGDGTIDIFDMVTLKSYLMTGNKSGFSIAAADLDEDGDVSVRDSIELSMYLMNVIGTFTYESKLDTDGDGLSDYSEKEITLTDHLNLDTDGDGLDDYTEVYLLKTDPLNKYTNGSKISDVDLDADSDGLKNGEELKYGTDLVLADTDEDTINDYDEIYGKVKSDPLKQDSDDDGISDFGELKLSLNPMIKKSDGLTLDSERYFQQELPEENLKDINTDENFYKLSVSAKMRGYAPETLSVRESVYSNLFDEYAVNGKIIDVVCPDEYKDSTGNFKLDLKFELKEGSNPEDYMIFKYVEDYYVLLPAETQWNGNILSLSDAGDGTYCIVDLNEINLEDLSNVSSDIENFNNEVVKSAMPADVNSDGIDLENLEILSDSEKVTASKSVSYTCIFNLGSSFKVGFWNAGVRDAVEGSVKKLFDNGYATSVTLIFKGSYGSGYYTVSINCTSLDDVKKLCNEATSFFSKNIDGNNASQEYTKVNANLGGKLRLSYSKLNYSSYVSSPTPVFVFNDVVSGAVCRFRSGGAACSVLKANTVINSIGANGAQKIYDIVTEGDGKTAYTASFLGKFFMGTKLTAQMVNAYKSNPQLTSAERKTLGFMDTDNDGIDDASEIAMNLIKVVGGKVVFPSFGEAAKNISVFTKGLELFAQKKAAKYDDVKAVQYLPQKQAINNSDGDGDGISDYFESDYKSSYSNPSSKDSDKDGIDDFNDPQPLVPNKSKDIDWNVWASVDSRDYMERRKINEMIFIGVQRVLKSKSYHSSVIIFASPSSDYYFKEEFMNSVADYWSNGWNNIRYVTLGAGQKSLLSGDPLTAGYNRERDLMLDIKVQMKNLTTSADVNNRINELIKNHQNYLDIQEKSGPSYDLYPKNGDEQNSNSYAAGLLIASNIDDLGKPEYNVPGYQYPLKKSYFGVGE